jgi:hypothetical protein
MRRPRSLGFRPTTNLFRRTLQSATYPGPLHMTHSSLYLQKSPPVTHHCHTQRAATSTTCLTQGNHARLCRRWYHSSQDSTVQFGMAGLHVLVAATSSLWAHWVPLAAGSRARGDMLDHVRYRPAWFGSDFPSYQSGIADRESEGQSLADSYRSY